MNGNRRVQNQQHEKKMVAWWSLARRRRGVVMRHVSTFPTPKIELTPQEEKLFEVLQFVRKKYAPKTTLRVAGGWVRDKLLGIPSDDIDIALDTMTGEAFVKKILKFQNACGVPVKGFYIVKKNAEQSKHLECAAVKLLGHELDFVHLRNESYTDSRIPTLSDVLATPEEDALRRDITINALFYNLTTQSVEDFTEKGILDLHRQVIRTPLPPTETFLDDPLRVLRAIRFACQYDFTLDAALRQAIQSEKVKTALVQKITRERIGIEVRKMLSGTNPAMAIQLLGDANLLPIVLPTTYNASTAAGLAGIRFVQAHARLVNAAAHDKTQFDFRQMLASVLLPMAGGTDLAATLDAMLTHQTPLDDDAAIVEHSLAYFRQSQARDLQAPKRRLDAIKDELKWSKAESKHVADLVEAAERFLVMVSANPARLNIVHLNLWCRHHATQFNQVMPMLWHCAHPTTTHETQPQVAALQSSGWASVTLSKVLMKAQDLQKAVGTNTTWKLSELLHTVAVWEWMHPEATLDDELAFVETVLAPRVQADK
ncbi:Aste57867_5961 [Aphanomyces stellatus]|uniref:Aste57867_5961 protein n=1 Tax=Aphanomyces stellatus TaxID=120398 RepID=A0A485KG37_9STRA|nr:hypothetical protein As57867_005947 [Aphanomyces stellatus]VFT82978.1 Aste57867_5961 [Aphanomyces stellatus]